MLDATVPVVIDFWAPWCGPCKAIGPVLEQLAEDFGGLVKVAKVNVDDEPGLASSFQVQGIPTLVAIYNKRIAAKQIGFRGRPGLEQMFRELTATAEQQVAQA